MKLAAMPLAIGLVCAGGWFVQAGAQTETAPVQPPPATAPGSGDLPQGTTPPPQAGPLGDRLSESKGVLKPPKGIDPGIVKPAPETGAGMPVIPPPGSEPGDKVVPK